MKHLNYRTKFREGNKRISLGALSGILVALASFLGYFLAYGWRVGEAHFYGIEQGLVSVTLEDGLRFALPLILIFACVAVVFGADRSEEEAKKSWKAKRAWFWVSLLAFVVDIVVLDIAARGGQGFVVKLTLVFGIVSAISLFVSLIAISLNKWKSISAVAVVTLAYLAVILFNTYNASC